MKMPEPLLHGGITVTAKGSYKSTEDGYTAEQMKQYGRDLLEEAAKYADEMGMLTGPEIRVMKETL